MREARFSGLEQLEQRHLLSGAVDDVEPELSDGVQAFPFAIMRAVWKLPQIDRARDVNTWGRTVSEVVDPETGDRWFKLDVRVPTVVSVKTKFDRKDRPSSRRLGYQIFRAVRADEDPREMPNATRDVNGKVYKRVRSERFQHNTRSGSQVSTWQPGDYMIRVSSNQEAAFSVRARAQVNPFKVQGRVLRVSGTNQGDTLNIQQTDGVWRVQFNDWTVDLSARDVRSIQADLKAGQDQLFLTLGEGRDRVTIDGDKRGRFQAVGKGYSISLVSGEFFNVQGQAEDRDRFIWTNGTGPTLDNGLDGIRYREVAKELLIQTLVKRQGVDVSSYITMAGFSNYRVQRSGPIDMRVTEGGSLRWYYRPRVNLLTMSSQDAIMTMFGVRSFERVPKVNRDTFTAGGDFGIFAGNFGSGRTETVS